MRLHHLHLQNPIPYTHSLRLQESLLSQHFAYNTSRLTSLRSSNSSPSLPHPPNPTLLTFQTHPTYTVGRRHLKTNPLSSSQTTFLTSDNKLASFHPSPRGGLLTYHAPGQLTGYLICDLRVHGITPRCHVRVWEDTVIKTAKRFGVLGGRTEDPGVWIVDDKNNDQKHGQEEGGEKDCDGTVNDRKMTDRKLCAIGVHVSRGITSHGIGFNVLDAPVEEALRNQYRMPSEEEVRRIKDGVYDGAVRGDSGGKTERANGYLSWGFSRIVACGLEGKSVTWLTREGAGSQTRLEDVAGALAEELCVALTEKGKIRVDDVQRISEEDVLGEEAKEIERDVEGILNEKGIPNLKGGLEDWVGVLKGGKL